MTKIQRLSSYLLTTFHLFIAIIPMFLILRWVLIALQATDISNSLGYFASLSGTIETPEGHVKLTDVPWTTASMLLGFCADVLSLLPFYVSLFILRKLFSQYRDGQIFTQDNATLYRSLGVLYFIDALLITSLSHSLMVLAVTFNNPEGHRYLTVSFGTPNLSSLFYGAVVIVVSKVMFEASKLHDEQKFTV